MVEESIGVLKGQCTAIDQRLAIVHKAVVVVKALEDPRIHKPSRAEPTTGEVDARDITTADTHVHDLNGVGGNTTWEWARGTLVYHYVCLATLFSWNSVWFVHFCR